MGISYRIAIGLAAVALGGVRSPRYPLERKKAETPAVAQWRARVPTIQKTLEASKEESCRGAPAPEIIDAFGLSTDQLSVALVDYCSSGAYSDSIVPMLLDHGRPVAVRFRSANGKNIQTDFVSGASAMHSRTVKLVAERKAIYDSFIENDGQGKIATCGLKAYVWNAHSRTFDLDTPLSKSAGEEYCRRMRAKH